MGAITRDERMSVRSVDEILREAEHFEIPKSQCRVLVVDDEEVVRDLLRELFEEEGYVVETAKGGGDAVQKIAAFDPLVVLVDKNLPDLSGVEVVRSGRKMSPSGQFIMMTGYASLDSAIQAVELGAFGYLIKPFDDIERVLAQTRAAFAKHRDILQNEYLVRKLREAFGELFQARTDADIQEALATGLRRQTATVLATLGEILRPLRRLDEEVGALADYTAGEAAAGNPRAAAQTGRAKLIRGQIAEAAESAKRLSAAVKAMVEKS